MESNPSANPDHPNVEVTNRTAATPSTGSSAAGPASMFNNTHSPYIAGGSFSITTNTTSVNTIKVPSLDALYKSVAPHAILNAGGRADEVRCHPGTREEVIGHIEKWRDAQDGLTPPIFWLSGPAGAGKTAIVQTIAERCNAQQIPQANFFFFRTDTSRNTLSPLVATLVHQIILLYPSLRDPVATVLSTNPLILTSILEDQLRQLVVTPLQIARQSSSSYLPPLLLIDGLDECKSENKYSQRQILHAFDKVLAQHPCPFRLLVASRDESQIRATFNNISSPLIPLYLDDEYFPEVDIRVFVKSEFERIQKAHPLAHTLDATWPSVKDVESIVRKSSGQFIYAATVMRFVMDSSASPMLSLARVQGAAQISANSRSPFSHLDTIYTYILSQVDDQEILKDILHAQLLIRDYSSIPSASMFMKRLTAMNILQAYNRKYIEARLQSCVADLTSIAQYTRLNGLLFYHASFPDYLLDQSRSEGYFVDIDAFSFKIQPAVWEACCKLEQYTDVHLGLREVASIGLNRLRQLPPGLLNNLTAKDIVSVHQHPAAAHLGPVGYFKHIHSLCVCDDDMTKYKEIIRQWIRTRPKNYHPEWPPCSHRYLAMTHIEDHLTEKPPTWVDVALRTETDSDAHETAVWLTDLLRRIHSEIYTQSIPEYHRLVGQWVSWAVCNDIPLNGVDNLPKFQWHRAMAHIKQNAMTEPHGWIDIALRPETNTDVRETATWLNTLLHRIYREKYPHSIQDYKRILRIWTSWAARNNIPLNGVDDLPKGRWYLQRSRMEKWAATHLKLGNRTG